MVAGLILAGGRSRRFGADKRLAQLAGRTLLDWVIQRAASQVTPLILNANCEQPGGPAMELPLVRDESDDFPGPLAGILAGMQWLAGQAPAAKWVATFAVDTPFFPESHVEKLFQAANSNGAPAIPRSGGRDHPVMGLWPISALDDLRECLSVRGERKIMAFARQLKANIVEFEDMPFDPYLNINTPEDLNAAQEIAQHYFMRAPS